MTSIGVASVLFGPAIDPTSHGLSEIEALQAHACFLPPLVKQCGIVPLDCHAGQSGISTTAMAVSVLVEVLTLSAVS